MGFPGGAAVKNLPADAGDAIDMGSIPGSGGSPEKEMTPCCNILASEIPWTEEPGRLRPMGWQRI